MPHRSNSAQVRPRNNRDVRLAGFLHLSPRRTALIAAGVVALMTFTYSLPATGAEVPTETVKVEGQSLKNDALAVTSVDRDDFTVSAAVLWPVGSTARISTGFGYRVAPCAMCSSDHRGADFNPGAGTPIQAIAAGVVREVGNPSGELGVYAVIDHVIDGKLVSSVYAHMKFGSLSVRPGDEVAPGDIVGLVGSSGQSTGPHLHFGILAGGETPIDPVVWLRKHAI